MRYFFSFFDFFDFRLVVVLETVVGSVLLGPYSSNGLGLRLGVLSFRFELLCVCGVGVRVRDRAGMVRYQ